MTKNVWAMLSPVKTRKMDDIERPITAAKTRKTIRAVAGLHAMHRRRQAEDEGERREHDHPLQRADVDRLPEGGELPVLERHRRGAVGDQAGDRQADRHVVVDAEHEGAQALIDT